MVRVVGGIDFSLPRGSCYDLVSESGSGKSPAALACMRLIEATTAGRTHLDGETSHGLAAIRSGRALSPSRHVPGPLSSARLAQARLREATELTEVK